MQNSKIYTIFAGINGAGKSTLFAMDKSQDFGVRLNSDEIVKNNGQDWKDVKAQIEAGKEIIRLQNECFEKGLSLNRETTLSGNNIVESVKTAKQLGYVIRLRYVGVSSSEIAKKRIAKRIALGGHGVSDDTVDRRFDRSIENFKKVYELCDTVNIFDNSGESMILVAYSKNGQIIRTETECKWCDELLENIYK